MANASSPAASIKRKRNDPNFETITLDPHYNLVLIVDTPARPDGQKAFRVNKGSMRHVSDIWLKMLTGDLVESKQSEIEFPDDSWKPFEIVLKIAHMKVKELPAFMSVESLQALATLTDKYNLTDAVRMGLELRDWLHKYRDEWKKWPSPQATQHFASMTSIFKYDSDLAFLTSKLAVEVFVDNGQYLAYGTGPNKTRLSSSLPDSLLANINKIRNGLLWHFAGCCKLAIADATRSETKCPCRKAQCAAMKAGILITDLTTAGLFPLSAETKELHRNVLWYWRCIQRIGEKHKDYSPCDKTGPEYTYCTSFPMHHRSSTNCSFAACFGDFGIKNAAKIGLKQRLHEDVHSYMQTDAFMNAEI